MMAKLMKKQETIPVNVTGDHPIGLIAKSLPPGENINDLISVTVLPVINMLIKKGQDPDQAQKEAFSLVMAHSPTTAQELVFATQMTLVHVSMTTVAKQLQASEYLESIDSFGNLMTKLGRLSLEQVNSFQKLRGKGQQRIVVEKVNVESGGQAAIGINGGLPNA